MRALGPTQHRILQSLVARCEYGFSPSLKIMAADAGLNPMHHGVVMRALDKMRARGLVEKRNDQWRPTRAGLDHITI